MEFPACRQSVPQQLKQFNHQQRKSIVWGVVLIALGTLFMLDQWDVLDLSQYWLNPFILWHVWPLIISVLGLVEILSANSLKQVTHGALKLVIGIWIYACLEELWGWTFKTTWPIVVIAYGISILIRGLNPSKNDQQESSK